VLPTLVHVSAEAAEIVRKCSCVGGKCICADASKMQLLVI
jgi:hypothetical protein